jgi:hypothetical protein
MSSLCNTSNGAGLFIFFLANREESMLSEVSVLGGLLDGEKVES